MRRLTVGAMVAGLVLSTVTVPAAAQSSRFGDVPDDNVHVDHIERAADLGIILGVNATTFEPRRDLTRGEAASILARVLENAGVALPPASEGRAFPDDAGAHQDRIRQLEAAGVFNGTRDGRAAPTRSVHRDQFAALAVRAIGAARGEVPVASQASPFTDVDGNVHAEQIAVGVELGLFQGTTRTTFNPRGFTKRDQAARIAVGLFDELDDGEVVTDNGEVWALDQGTDLIHVHDGDDDFAEIATIDVRPQTLEAQGFTRPRGDITVPHMIEFDSQERYAFIASTAGGVTIVVDARSKEVVEVLDTGAGTHMAAVTPDDASVWVAVIGTSARDEDGNRSDDGSQRFTEITFDLDDEDPTFAIGDELLLADLVEPWEDGTEASYDFPSLSPICHQFTTDSTEAWLTLGPAWNQGGLVVVDLEAGELSQAYDPTDVKANCGVSVTEDRAVVNWSGQVVDGDNTPGEWYVFDTETYEQIGETRDANGFDTHGLRLTPDGSEYWQVNRLGNELQVIDADTLEVIDERDDIADTPDIIDYSPDGSLAYLTQRGPNPRSGAVHAASGDQPGFAVVDVASRERVVVIEHDPITDGDGDLINDVHGIGVRSASDADTLPGQGEATVTPAASGGADFTVVQSLDAPRPVARGLAFHCGL